MRRYRNIKVERSDGVAWITLNRPDRLNALSEEMLDELSAALDEVEEDKEVRCTVITGEGERAFCAGAEIEAFLGMSPSRALEFSRRGHEVFGKIERMSKPAIAAIDGYCLGGGLELALACDLRVASERAKLGSPEIRLGLIPGWGGTQRLARAIGPARAKELVMLGDRVTAEEALRMGLVHRVVHHDKLSEEVNALARRLVEGPPVALKQAKYAIQRGIHLPLEAGLELEAHAFAALFSTRDKDEGIEAFRSRRKPTFKGE